MTEPQDAPRVLAGIRVADFTHAGVGPCATKYLADAGAEVIKIETRTRVEVIRRGYPFKKGVYGAENSAQFASYNNNKLGVTINLKQPKGLKLVKRLIAISDVVADSFTPGVMDKLGLGYEDLKKIKPDIIQIGMSFAGRKGPYAHQRGHGPILAALVGFPGLVGWEGGRPMAPSLAYTDYYLPQLWAMSVVCALLHRDATGEGRFIDASDFEAAIDVLDTGLLEFSLNGRPRRRLGNRHEWAVPHGCYPCKGEDRWCVIAVFEDGEWESLCRAMGKPELACDERFASFSSRRANEDALDEIIAAWTCDKDSFAVMHLLQQAGVPAGAVEDARDTLSDPQLQHRQHYPEVPGDPDADWFTYEKQGFQMSETPLRIERRVLRMGEHNDYVLRDLLGTGEEERAALSAEGALE